ncbi:MAG: hypothetical protein ABSF29_02285 [Tepidisphaeraceae bacterium]|jgi:hypothetical protein
MLRTLYKTFFMLLLILAGSAALLVYHHHMSAEYQIERLQAQNEELQQIAQRLQTERRVAKILVTDQKQVNGNLQTTLLFVEYRRDGSALPARQFIIPGNEAHIDAEVVKFKDEFVKEGDPLRGQSILLFVRIYGASQSPDQGQPIDAPNSIPEIYRGANPQVSEFEQGIWAQFWSLYNDSDARDALGIRAMHGEGLYGPFDRQHLYTITVRPDGATMNVDPLEPIYRAALGGN